MPRIKPYTTNSQSWNAILDKPLEIPMNQRQYDWDDKDIKSFVEDIIEVFREDKYIEKMGTLILFNNDEGRKEIWDGQQRTLTIILLLTAISKMYPELKEKVENLLLIDENFDSLTDKQKKIRDKYYKIEETEETEDQEQEEIKIPKIYCVNHNDIIALIDIFNDKFHSFYQFIQCDEDDEDDEDDEESNEDNECDEDTDNSYKCNICLNNYLKKNFKKHLFEHQKICDGRQPNTKIYNSFNKICNVILQKKVRENEIKNFYKFIINEIDIQVFDSNDIKYVSKIFEWENNRGKKVNELDVLKNKILTLLPDDKKEKCFEKWTKLKLRDDLTCSRFGEKIFNLSLQLYSGKIVRVYDFDEFYQSIRSLEYPYKQIDRFFKINNELVKYYNETREDKYGRLITKSRRVNIAWEGYMFLLFPIFYATKEVDPDLIKLLVKWCFRNIGLKSRTFNNLAYSNGFIEISNNVLKNKNYKYIVKVKELLKLHAPLFIIEEESYISSIIMQNFKSTVATYVLYFLETCMNTDTNVVSLENTLEHIVSQKDKDKLEYKNNIHKLGNLTLLEGKNSENGHKGNSSIQNKSYDIKKQSYDKSSIKMTQDLSRNYPIFNESQISKRTEYIAKLLHQYTDYIS